MQPKPGKFRKKPVIIEARQVIGSPTQVLGVADWCGGTIKTDVSEDGKALVPSILIHTLEGVMEASSGDWIIKGVAGEFYPCKPDIFDKTYEPVE